jgi:soluble lytic murein transglycosylase-like protein
MKNNPTWAKREPSEVSASYGLMQVMYDVAWKYGFRGKTTELYDPATSIEYGSRYFREILDEAIKEILYLKIPYLTPMRVALARYNGGPTGNPDKGGALRNEPYVDKVMAAWTKIHFNPVGDEVTA